LSKKLTHQEHECLYCKWLGEASSSFEVSENWKMVGLDRPYVNLWFHASCFKKIEGDILDFIKENRELWDKNA